MRQKSRGAAFVYGLFIVVVLCGITSLAVDFGRVQAAKTQLRAAADAAALYGAAGIANGTAVSNAIQAASENGADASPVVLLASDVVLGTWTPGTFTSGGASPNAIQVTAHRSQARGTAVPLLFGQVIGMNTCDVTATSTATYAAPARGYALFGMQWIRLVGNASIDSYNPAAGPYSTSTAQSLGDIGTNGSATLTGNATVHGDLEYGPGQSYSLAGNARVTGAISQLSSPQSFGVASAGSAATTNNNGSISSSYLSNGNFAVAGNSTVDVPAGTYYFNSMSLAGNSVVNFQGPVTVYVNGAIAIAGTSQINTFSNLPANLQIYGLSGASANIAGNGSLYAQFYAPDSPFTVSGNGAFYGAMIGQSINVTGNGAFHYDGSNHGGGGSVSLVQ